MQNHSTTVVQTVACDLGNCGSCRGQVVTLTLGLDAPVQPCAHICHLPDAWREQVAAYPPCDDDQELEQLLELDGDRLLENEFVGVWSL